MHRKAPRAISPRLRSALLLLVVSAFASVVGCDNAGVAGPDTTPPPILIPDEPVAAPRTPATAALDRTLQISLPGYGEAHADSLADTDLLMFQLRTLLSDDGAENVRRIRAANPDVIIIGSLQLLTIFPHWNDEWHRERMTLGRDLWNAIHDRPARTTTGDLVPMWSGMTTLNPLRDGRLDAAMLDEVVDAIVRHFARYPGVVDGIMHDYTAESPWIYPSPQEANIGEVDLDQDGIPYGEDPEERAAWIGWQEQIVIRLQERIGPGLIQIANGRMAVERPSFTRLIAGAYFEHFPSMTWHQPQSYGFERMYEITRADGLTPRRGRTWSMLSPPAGGAAGDLQLRRLANLLFESHYARRETIDALVVGEAPTLEVGTPLGPVVRERGDNGGLRYRRPFTNGEVVVEFAANGNFRASTVPPQGR